jgi:hypothetical protein
MSCLHIHQDPDQEVRSIAGYYKVLEEGRLALDGREVLYIVEIAHVETSCCGSGGIGFILIPGYIISWKSCRDEAGLCVSEVERIVDPEIRKRISGLLKKQYPYIHQVSFA